MAKTTTLKAESRARTGSGSLKQMRREGWLPSVIYGKGTPSTNLKVNAKTFSELLAHSTSENILINLEIDGKDTKLAFLQSVQHDAISGNALHVDFLAIDSNTKITAHIPAHLNGEAPGVKAGGVVEQYLHSIEITCLPNDLPESIEIDITKLQLGESLHLGDISYPKGVTHTHSDDVVVVHIGRAGSGAEQAEAAAAAAPATEAKS